jgi:hypothetical protein
VARQWLRRSAVVGVLGAAMGLASCTEPSGTSASVWEHPAKGAFSELPPPMSVSSVPSAGFVAQAQSSNGTEATVYSWSGHRLWTFHASPGYRLMTDEYPSLAPDGEAMLSTSLRGDVFKVTTPSGEVLERFSAFAGVLWGNDSRHLCAIEYSPRQNPAVQWAKLVVISPGHGTKFVAKVNGGGDEAGDQLIACDVTSRIAVLEGTLFGSGQGVTYVNLATGSQWTAPWYKNMGSVQLSGNGKYAASGGSSRGGFVVDTSTGRVVGHFPGAALGITWLGDEVLEIGDNFEVPQLYDWKTHKAVWTAPGFSLRSRVSLWIYSSSRAGTDDMAVNVTHGGGSSAFLWIITPRGATLVSRDVSPAQP